jgi:hypothetical protein
MRESSHERELGCAIRLPDEQLTKRREGKEGMEQEGKTLCR